MRLLPALVISGLALLGPMNALADEEKPPAERKPKNSLLETQQRLDALIKAAAAHNLVDVGQKDQSKKGHGKAALGQKKRDLTKCVVPEIFSFPKKTRVTTYGELVGLRNSIVTGPNEFDKDITRLLVLAYIGLGFGEEALVFAEYFDGRERDVLIAMARTVDGLESKKDAAILSAENKCFYGENNSALLWSRLAGLSFQKEGDAREELTIAQLKTIKAMPKNVTRVMRERFGVAAVQHGSLDEAKYLIRDLKTKKSGPIGDETLMLESMHMLAENKAGSRKILEKLAQKEGPVQAKASKLLSETKKGGADYQGYEEDLDALIQVYGDKPEGKQALAQKIKLYSENGKFSQAVSLTKNSLDPEGIHYQKSLSLLGKQLKAALLEGSDQQKLSALNTLVAEIKLFNHMRGNISLKQAGVNASIDLGIADLSAHILSKNEWGKLSGDTVKVLALALPSKLKPMLPAATFRGEGFDVINIKAAFKKRQPKQAMAILGRHPKNEEALQMTAHQAWQGGYWGLARNAMDDLNAQGKETSVRGNLATALSVPSPLMTVTKRKRSIAELKALQAFLDSDLEIIKGYVNGG